MLGHINRWNIVKTDQSPYSVIGNDTSPLVHLLIPSKAPERFMFLVTVIVINFSQKTVVAILRPHCLIISTAATGCWCLIAEKKSLFPVDHSFISNSSRCTFSSMSSCGCGAKVISSNNLQPYFIKATKEGELPLSYSKKCSLLIMLLNLLF